MFGYFAALKTSRCTLLGLTHAAAPASAPVVPTGTHTSPASAAATMSVVNFTRRHSLARSSAGSIPLLSDFSARPAAHSCVANRGIVRD
jgi:hypothetical protein